MKQLKKNNYWGKVKTNRDHKPQKNKMEIPRLRSKYKRDWEGNNKKIRQPTQATHSRTKIKDEN